MKKRNILIVIGCIVFLLISIPFTYALYKGEMNVHVSATTGSLVCDVLVDTNDNYIENNEAFFFITVNNFATQNGKNILTATDVDYTLTIQNKGTSKGLFRYVDEDGNTNTVGEETVVIQNGRLGKTKQSKKIKVYVTTESNLKSKVDFDVKLNAKQANMG